ncbi:hypothetical protein ACWGJ9_11450 [Curtobacterium citreum]
MDHRTKRPQRRTPRRASKPQQPVWRILLEIGSFPLTLIGLIVVIAGFAINLPQDKPALDANTRLHQVGEQVTGTVKMVEEDLHHTKHGSYRVYTPYVEVPVHGERTVVELDDYAVVDKPAVYREGQHLPMLVAPHVRSERDIAIADAATRDRLTAAVHSDIIGGCVGSAMFLVGGPFLYQNFRRSSKGKGRR